jgi:transposase
MQADHTDAPAAGDYATVLIVFELSKATWQLGVAFPGTTKMSRYLVDGGNLEQLSGRLAAVEARVGRSGKPARVMTCFEAGLDGHWLHRWLIERGITSHVVDASSIEVSRRARRAKTDRIDLALLMRAFQAYLRGESRGCSMVRVPSVEDEDRKRRTRERDALVKERTRHTNRIKALLFGQGIRDAMPLKPGFLAELGKLRTGDGRPLPPHLQDEVVRQHERLMLVHRQIRTLEAQNIAAHQKPATGSVEAKTVQLAALKGLGTVIAQDLANEVFYRRFDNRRQVGSYVGLTGTPYDSGASHREQGISKAGNHRARRTAVELAWLWLRHQPGSALTRWFHERVGNAKGRVRKLAIVALARKLMVALWRYLETGVVPTGAAMRQSF